MSKTTKHTVTTLLSADGVALVEDFLKWFWDSFDGESFTRELMHIFSVYVEHCTKDCHYYQQPQFLKRFLDRDF